MTDTTVITETLKESVDSLGQAIEIDPDYPDPQCFLGIIQVRFLGSPASAVPFLERCLDGNPPTDIRGLVEPLLDEARAS